MEYLSIIVSVSSVIVALLAAYISKKNKSDLEKQLLDFYNKKQRMKDDFEHKSREMHL